MHQPTDIIKRPIITEKTTWEGHSRNRYSFEVALTATKSDIRAAVAELYKVRVLKVSTQIRKGEYKRTRFGEAQQPGWKRATVELHADDKIDLL